MWFSPFASRVRRSLMAAIQARDATALDAGSHELISPMSLPFRHVRLGDVVGASESTQ